MDTTADQRTHETICEKEERCGVCGEYIWWDDTPNPICDACAAKPNALTDALARVAELEAALAEIAKHADCGDHEGYCQPLGKLARAALGVTPDAPGGTR